MPQGQQLPVHALGRALVELMKVLLQRIHRVLLPLADYDLQAQGTAAAADVRS